MKERKYLNIAKRIFRLIGRISIITVVIGSIILSIIFTNKVFYGEGKQIKENTEYITLEVVDRDGRNINSENFKYNSNDYRVRTSFSNTIVIDTENFKAKGKDYGAILYDKKLKNYIEDYKDIIENNNITSDEKINKIRNDISENDKSVDSVLILKSSTSGRIVGVFKGNFTSENNSSSRGYIDHKKIDWWNLEYLYYKN